MIAAADTGAWSLYSLAGREATLGYHQLIEELLRRHVLAHAAADLLRARATGSPATSASRRGSAIAPLRKLRARHLATVRFSISKVSSVVACACGAGSGSRSRAISSSPHGSHSVLLGAARARALPHADHGAGPAAARSASRPATSASSSRSPSRRSARSRRTEVDAGHRGPRKWTGERRLDSASRSATRRAFASSR